MKRLINGLCAFVFLLTVVNCAQKDMNGAATTSGEVVKTDQGESVTLPLELATAQKAPSNNLPLEKIDVPSELITLLTPNLQNVSSGSGGVLSGILGGGACGILSSVLGIGATFLTGGNPILGMIVPQIANSLLKCGSQSPLTNLISGGASGNQQIFALISQIMQAQAQGKDPFALLNAIKNPKDLSSIISIVMTLVNQTGGNAELQNILGLLTNFQTQFGGAIGQCDNMNATACQVFQIVNQVRKKNGLKALVPNLGCTLAAQSHSKDMFENSIFTHTGSTGVTSKARYAQYGLKAAAENIVRGDAMSAQQAVEMWMSSASHKSKILSADYTGAGVGYLNGYFTQCFTK